MAQVITLNALRSALPSGGRRPTDEAVEVQRGAERQHIDRRGVTIVSGSSAEARLAQRDLKAEAETLEFVCCGDNLRILKDRIASDGKHLNLNRLSRRVAED